MSPDEMVAALKGLRRKHFAAAEKHQLAEKEIAENSDPEGDECYGLYWHRSMAEVHHCIASDLAALISPSAIVVAELRGGAVLMADYRDDPRCDAVIEALARQRGRDPWKLSNDMLVKLGREAAEFLAMLDAAQRRQRP